MANPIQAAKRASDFIRDFGLLDYITESAYVENPSGAAVVLKGPMYPLKAGTGAGFVEVMTAVESQTPSNIVGFLIVGAWETLAATTGVSQQPYQYIVNGPAIVSSEGYATTDLAGAAYDSDDLDVFAAAASPFIKVRTNSGLTSAPYAL